MSSSDSSLEVTEAWLRSVGFTDIISDEQLRLVAAAELKLGWLVWTEEDRFGHWYYGGMRIPGQPTRRDVLRLIRALRIQSDAPSEFLEYDEIPR